MLAPVYISIMAIRDPPARLKIKAKDVLSWTL